MRCDITIDTMTTVIRVAANHTPYKRFFTKRLPYRLYFNTTTTAYSIVGPNSISDIYLRPTTKFSSWRKRPPLPNNWSTMPACIILYK